MCACACACACMRACVRARVGGVRDCVNYKCPLKII